MEAFITEFEHLKIRLEEIKSATNDFKDTNIIGIGGFGWVYVGELPSLRSMVAIKRLKRTGGQGDVEFWKEITTLTRHTHKNLIALLGFCIEAGEMILVYKYESNGSLERHLRDRVLTWTHRLKICLDVARVLSFLHDANDTRPTIIHRDIKSGNILLDADWNAKLSDLGLSETIPTNQQQTGVVNNPVGTIGYTDPQYVKTGLLTKESDVYSFGVVLLEVLCGRLCFDRSSGNMVPTWISSYKQNNLQAIILNYLKPQMDQKSLKIYSDMAFRCLQSSGVGRPTMANIVKELEKALKYQELHERLMLADGFKEMLMITEEDPLNKMPETELKLKLLEGTPINRGKTWFSVNMDGKHCELISIAECLISTASDPGRYIRSFECNSRFAAGCYEPLKEGFKTHVRAQFLSPEITYTVNLVFKRKRSKEQYIGLEYKLEWEDKKSYSFVSDEREDGSLTTELYQFTSHQRTFDIKIRFYTKHCDDLLVEGIEFRPLEKVEHEVLRDESVDVQRTLNTGEEGHSYVNNIGKKCLMLPAEAVLEGNKWVWKNLPETRFEKVADCNSEKFNIVSKFSAKLLSPHTTYAAYLVYRLPRNYNDVNPPAQVVDKTSDSKEAYNIFLRPPKTPVIIGRNVKDKAYAGRPKIKGVPKQRIDNWMEVQVCEFRTRATSSMISTRLQFSSYDKSLPGVTVQGLEFRPI